MEFKALFRAEKPIIGMIHLAGKDPVKRALDELKIFEAEGISGAIVENYYGSIMDVRRTLELAAKQNLSLILGVNVLPNEFQDSFSLAHNYGARFIQLDQVAGRYVEMHGRASSNASKVKQLDHTAYSKFRRNYPNLVVLGGVHPKYYVPIAESNLEEDLKKGMERAEAIVVTGEGTGMETPIEKIREFRIILGDYPLIVGAGLNPENAEEQLSVADGAIVGSALKTDNQTGNILNLGKIRTLMNIVESIN